MAGLRRRTEAKTRVDHRRSAVGASVVLVLVALAIVLSGCVSVTQPTQPPGGHDEEPAYGSASISGEGSIGQTFVAGFDGLNGVDVAVEPTDAGDDAVLLLTLYDAPGGESIAAVSVPMSQVDGPGFVRFPFPALDRSNGKRYFVGLATEGAASVDVRTAAGSTYPDGALHVDEQPDPHRQLLFRLSYDGVALGAGIKGEVLVWAWYVLVAAAVFVVPGWALLALAFRRAVRPFAGWDWFLKLTASVGVSLALYPVRMLVAKAVGLQPGAALAWLPPVVGLIVIVWLHRDGLRTRPVRWPRWRPDWCDVTLIVLTVLLFVTRFWVIRPVDVPLWGDSYQHAMMTQLMLNNGGLFDSWAPYTPYTSLTIQYGFSALAALFGWLSPLDGTGATLWMGQVVNVLAVLTIYPLAVRVSRGNRWAGVGALLIGGLVLSFPAFYVNWGRYAQLAGQAVLPVALWLTWETIDQQAWSWRRDWPQPLLGGLALTGMTLHYYRTPFLYAAFIVVLLLFWAVPTYRSAWRDWGHALLRLLVIGFVSLVLFAPWLANMMSGKIAYGVEAGVTIGEPRSWVLQDFEILRQLDVYVPDLALLLIGAAVLWAVYRRNWIVVGLPIWFVLLLGYRAGALARLPAANMLRVFAVLIAAYIPISLIVGWLFGEVISALESRARGRKMVSALALASVVSVLAGVWFGWQQLGILQRSMFELVSKPDQAAFDWVRAETAPSARFLVQGFPYNDTVAGSDAGWWMPLLAMRENTIPPQYAQFNESSDPADYTQRVVTLYELVADHGVGAPECIELLCDWGVTHVYQGQKQGASGGTPLFMTSELDDRADLFVPVYSQDRVRIFELRQSMCEDPS